MSLLKELLKLQEQSCLMYIDRFINQLRDKIKVEPFLYKKIVINFESSDEIELNKRIATLLKNEGFIINSFTNYLTIQIPESSYEMDLKKIGYNIN